MYTVCAQVNSAAGFSGQEPEPIVKGGYDRKTSLGKILRGIFGKGYENGLGESMDVSLTSRSF